MELHLLLIAPVILLGLTIGSFLNVVIFRLPRDLSVRRPRWSFCPACAAPIRAIDNVPVWSWLRLGGRCRQCKAVISLQYPVVELLTAMLFLAVYDALVIGRVRWDVGTARIDALVVVAYWVLFACLLANAVMDIEEYIIDVRLTYLAAAAGILLNAAWRTAAPAAPPGAAPPLVLAAAGAGLAWLATAAWLARRARAVETPASDEAAPQTTNDAADAALADGIPDVPGEVSADAAVVAEEAESAAPEPSFGGRAAAVMILALSLVGLGLAAGGWPGPATGVGSAWFIGRCVAVLAVLTFVLVLSAMLPRRADEEIVEALAAERPSARRQAWREALALLPAAAAGAAGVATALRVDVVSAWVTACSQPLAPWYCRGLAGAADAAAAMVGAAALGWAVRIGFTLALGKEAYGVGDIHFMAAIGAVAGFWTCLIGFFLASLLALCGAAAMMFRKSCRVLPFGPWLGLGALAATWVRDPAAAQLQLAARTLWNVVTGHAFGSGIR